MEQAVVRNSLRYGDRVSKCFACIGLVIRTMLLVGADRPLVCGFQPPPQPPGLLPRRQLDRSEKESPREDHSQCVVDDGIRWGGDPRNTGGT